MFDVSWSELLILGLVTLIFVGPKELPRFLGTLGRYAGVVRRHANEFRSVFEQAMREAQMEEIQQEVRAVSEGVKASLDEATRAVESTKPAAKVAVEGSAEAAPTAIAADAPGATVEMSDAGDEAVRPAGTAAEAAEAAEAKPTAGPA